MQEQTIIKVNRDYTEIDDYISKKNIKSIMLVCDTSIQFLNIRKYFEEIENRKEIKLLRFSDFTPNPLYESVEKGVELLRQEQCGLIIAVGGGSAIDVAKCIKLYSNMASDKNYLKQTIIPNDICLMAMPTTAGTGSEATKYAVIYYKGEKQSVCDESCIPEAVIMDASALKTLPLYQKKATMMDAMCHAIESFWSVNSTDESKKYSAEAIKIIIKNKEKYLSNEDSGNANMLVAANMAGKAINITQTTAGHAMCYKLTSLYGLAHGHAAGLCVKALWPYMVNHLDECIDPRGSEYLNGVFDDIAVAMGKNSVSDAIDFYRDFWESLELETPKVKDKNDFEILKKSVNPVRLKNNPVRLNEESIGMLYHKILS